MLALKTLKSEKGRVFVIIMLNNSFEKLIPFLIQKSLSNQALSPAFWQQSTAVTG